MKSLNRFNYNKIHEWRQPVKLHDGILQDQNQIKKVVSQNHLQYDRSCCGQLDHVP